MLRRFPGLLWLVVLGVAMAVAQVTPTPPGGTVRALAADPAHPGVVLLGTTTGVLFRSPDAGRHWAFYSRVAPHSDWVVASLVADASHPERWYAGLWSWAGRDGGVFESDDDGRSWEARFSGHAVRALALAPSQPAELVAATLDGVFRTQDGGRSWSLISPAHDRELANVESVAIDPANPAAIYVGTWHLPWRTLDGGQNWWQMRQGVIDDSDVFSIAIDRSHPTTVYLSACSGIYRSDDHGNQFRKIQGIPYSARRTPALVQDGDDPNTIYAGTTQGLWVTHDGGARWGRITAPGLSINAVLLLDHRILLGTNFAGVIASDDQGQSFATANVGFSSRHISSVAASPGGRYFAVTGDQAWGGIFFRAAGGGAWRQLPPTPGHDDVYALHWSARGLLAATAHGLYLLPPAAAQGDGAGHWLSPLAAPRDHIYALAGPGLASLQVLAASQSGLYRSANGGASWTYLRAAPAPLFHLLALPPVAGAANGDDPSWLWVAGSGYVLRSPDQGRHFIAGRLSLDSLPGPVAQINQLAALALPAGGAPLLLAATTRGLYLSRDRGASWMLCGHGLPALDVRQVHFQNDTIYALTARVGQSYVSRDAGLHWEAVQLPAATEAWARSAPGLALPWIRAAASATRSAKPTGGTDLDRRLPN